MKFAKFRLHWLQNVVSTLTFTLLYLSINISRGIQKPEWYTRKPGMYNETHQILITKIAVSLLTVPRSLYCIWVSILADVLELEWYKGKPRMYDETHQVQIAFITKCGLYTHGSLFALLYLGVNVSRCNLKQ